MRSLSTAVAVVLAALAVVVAQSAAAASAAAPTSVRCAANSATARTSGSAAATPVKVWMAGDSTMANPSGTCPVGWGSQFDALFNDAVTVINSAAGGRSVQTWLYDPNVTSAKNSAGECVISPQTYSVAGGRCSIRPAA